MTSSLTPTPHFILGECCVFCDLPIYRRELLEGGIAVPSK